MASSKCFLDTSATSLSPSSTSIAPPRLNFELLFNVFSDGQLDGSLTDLGQIRARKSFGDFSHITHVHGFSHWSFPQIGFQNGTSGGFIGQRDIDQLVKTSRTQNSRINDVRSVGSSDDKDVFLGSHTIHFPM